ncbi:hypothetical protein H5410_045406 [Solanum commersonii]|uniref:Uncharacterized protein n=1 Tax=Solanum commersonii TaxID=4109 RepID=A0A9J5XCN2_SOLCO|nr:hypothetical protein H5410_045406 [Solanum commersonii]
MKIYEDFLSLSTNLLWWEDPQFFIDPQDTDSILRVHLEPFEFNHPALCESWKACVGTEKNPHSMRKSKGPERAFRAFKTKAPSPIGNAPSSDSCSDSVLIRLLPLELPVKWKGRPLAPERFILCSLIRKDRMSMFPG